MKLQIKQAETVTGYIVALCDETGVPLPGQISIRVESRPDDIVTATVTFAVGDDVQIVDGDRRMPEAGDAISCRR